MAVKNETGLSSVSQILQTIQVGSTGAELIPGSGYFIISAKVASGTAGQTVSIYRSQYNDGNTWTANTPDTECILTGQLYCTFRTDHLSLFTLTTPSPFCDNVTDVSTGECNALVDLYNSTNGSGWTNKGGWLVNTGVCSWAGVTCSANHVYILDLQYKNLS